MVKKQKPGIKVILLIIAILMLVLSSCAPRVEIPSDSEGSNSITENQDKILKKITFIEPDVLTENINILAIPNQAKLPKFARPECTPVFIEIKGNKYIIVPTSYSSITPYFIDQKFGSIFESGEGSILSRNQFSLDEKNSWLATDSWSGGGLMEITQNWVLPTDFNADSAWENGQPYWRRSYYGIFDSRVVSINGEEFILSVMHGENKNESFEDSRGKLYNTIIPKREYLETEFSGLKITEEGKWSYSDYGGAYFGFIGMSLIPVEDFEEGIRFDDESYDYGPVIWPSMGYINDINIKTGTLRHPSMYISESHIYLYYIEDGLVKVARSPLESKGVPGSFMLYREGSFSSPALPVDFDKHSRNYLSSKVEKSDSILTGSITIRFSVAKISNTQYYLGVEEGYLEGETKLRIFFRISNNLVEWSEPITIPGTVFENYSSATLHYPVLYDAKFSNSNEIDINDFYVLGTSLVGRLHFDAIKFNIKLE